VGEFRIPLTVWHALTRLNIWIEPALIAEWTRLMQRYLTGQGRAAPEGTMAQALTWLDPERGTAEVRRLTAARLETGEPVFCVWSGRRLTLGGLDIDHCLPFAAWPNADLWNLMPAHRRVNRHEKVDRLIAAELLERAGDRILEWWEGAYLRRGDSLAARFRREAAASLPVDPTPDRPLGACEVLDALSAKRLMLKVTQQLPEWCGPSSAWHIDRAQADGSR
jgi:hypothetical protein